MYQYLAAPGTSITSQTTLQSDGTLTLPVAASRAYAIEAYLPFSLAGIASGYKFGISVPTSPTSVILTGKVFNDVTNVLASSKTVTAGGEIVSGALASIGDSHAVVTGFLENGANAGSVTVQVAQLVSDLGAIQLKRGCWLCVTPVA